MLGSIKAALASIATSIKSALPAVAAATTATVLVGGSIYYITIKDGIYEARNDNVRYVLEQYISQIALDSIVSNGHGGYAYTTDLDKMAEEILARLKEAESNISEYTGKGNEEEIIKKLIKAEIITQYPDLRSASEIKADKKVPENEVQGGIKIVRSDSGVDTSNVNSEDISEYNLKDSQVLTYKPYEEFKGLITNNNAEVKKYFSIKPSSVSSSLYGNFIVKTDDSNAAPVLTREQIENAIKTNYTGDGQANLLSALDAFMKIQEQYKVNAVFAIAVTQQESSCGTNWAAIDSSSYNWMSVKSDSNESGWAKYSSFADATEKFGELIASSSFYFTAGKYSVSDIALSYCDADWGNHINEHMAKIYNSIGISIDTSNQVTNVTQSNTNNSVDIVVAGWTEEITTVTKVEYIPKNDGSGDEKVAPTPEKQTKYTYNEVSINYQNMLSKYSMPAGFLWSLLVMGENANFVSKLADLAIEETNIVIEAQDNVFLTVNEDVQKYLYKKDIIKTVTKTVETATDVNSTDVQPENPTDAPEEPADGGTTTQTTQEVTNITATAKTESSITTTVETRQSNTNLNLVYAETWVAIYKANYKNTVNGEGSINRNWQEDKGVEWKESEDVNLGTTTEESVDTKLEITQYKIGNKAASSTQTANTNTFTVAGTIVKERDEIDEDKNFIEYFNKSGRAKSYILESPDWFYEMLESQDKTANMIDLFKYLLYKATDTDYGVTTFDFTVVSTINGNMNSVSFGTGYWWPIGSSTTETINGKLFAKGNPPSTVITSGVGPRWGRTHGGIDISGSFSIPGPYIIAADSGTVKFATERGGIYETNTKDILNGEDNTDGGGYGNYVIIDHGNGYETYYAHLYKGSILVKNGDKVEKGQVLGKMGSSGRSTGVHLHFEVRLNGTKLDPEEYVDPNNPRPSTTGIMQFIATFEGGTQYYNATTGEYTIFHNTLDGNLELTGGVAVGKKDTGVSNTIKKLINRNDLQEGSKISKEEYNIIFTDTYNRKVQTVNKVVAELGITLSQNQIDAVISFCYNAANAEANTRNALTKYKNEGEKGYWEVIHDFTHSNGVALEGLVRRRAEEFEMFTTGDYVPSGYSEAVIKHRQYNLKYGLPEYSGET